MSKTKVKQPAALKPLTAQKALGWGALSPPQPLTPRPPTRAGGKAPPPKPLSPGARATAAKKASDAIQGKTTVPPLDVTVTGKGPTPSNPTAPGPAVSVRVRGGGGVPADRRELMNQVAAGALAVIAKHKAKAAASPSPTAAPTSDKEIDMATKAKKGKTKKAAAPKRAAPSAATAKANGYDEGAKLVWLVKENPRREGSETHARFKKYSSAKTVGEYFAKGGTAGDLRWDVRHEYVRVSK
jgi:hypothetical protein